MIRVKQLLLALILFVAVGGSAMAEPITCEEWLAWDGGPPAGTVIGDVNDDGVFDSSDLVDLWLAGQYDSGEFARWFEGDWNRDCYFDSADWVFLLTYGDYQF